MEAMNPSAKAIYDAEIAPLMAQIIAICKEHRIPMMATFQYEKNEEDGNGFCTTRIPFQDESDRLEAAMNALTQAGLTAITITKVRGEKQGDSH